VFCRQERPEAGFDGIGASGVAWVRPTDAVVDPVLSADGLRPPHSFELGTVMAALDALKVPALGVGPGLQVDVDAVGDLEGDRLRKLALVGVGVDVDRRVVVVIRPQLGLAQEIPPRLLLLQRRHFITVI
jgi:hypothetical protein